jgi:hypothetical protein
MTPRSDLTRRQLLHTALAVPVVSATALRADPLTAPAPSSVLSQAPAAASHLHSPLYARLGVKTVINAYGSMFMNLERARFACRLDGFTRGSDETTG